MHSTHGCSGGSAALWAVKAAQEQISAVSFEVRNRGRRGRAAGRRNVEPAISRCVLASPRAFAFVNFPYGKRSPRGPSPYRRRTFPEKGGKDPFEPSPSSSPLESFSRDNSPPKRDTGIGSEKEWNIRLTNQSVSESGTDETKTYSWYRESGEELGEGGYRCKWTVMGGKHEDGSKEWKETWWEKSDWSGYKELGAEKSGRNDAEGVTWWETWKETFEQDDWSGLAKIEKSAQKRAKSLTDGMWSETWWEKYNAKGWTEKGARKYGKQNGESWWEKWGEQYDGRGAVVKWTDKWAEKGNIAEGTLSKWGDKWEERFGSLRAGQRSGETWHVSNRGERWSRTWGEEHLGNGKVHKFGKSTSGEEWDTVVEEPTYYEATPHYGWSDVIVDSTQLLSIEIKKRE